MAWRAGLNYLSGPAQVDVADGRAASLPGWETCGFERIDHAPAVQDWADDETIAHDHYPEMEALAAKLTGCDVALVSGHIKRNVDEAARHGDLGPITFVHSDFADSYGPLLRSRYVQTTDSEFAASLSRAGISGDDVARARRIVVLQFWRNVGPPKMDLPLAFCDCRTVPSSQVQAIPVTNYAGGGFDFEALGVRRPPPGEADHAWYAFDSLTADEAVAFRTFDSDRVGTGQPYWTPHSAFRDPDVELGRPSRSSIELRATCVFR